MGDTARRLMLAGLGGGLGLVAAEQLDPNGDPFLLASGASLIGAFSPELRTMYYQAGVGPRPENVPDEAWYIWQNMGPGYRSDYQDFDQFRQSYSGMPNTGIDGSHVEWRPNIDWATASERERNTAGRIFGQMYQNRVRRTAGV